MKAETGQIEAYQQQAVFLPLRAAIQIADRSESNPFIITSFLSSFAPVLNAFRVDHLFR